MAVVQMPVPGSQWYRTSEIFLGPGSKRYQKLKKNEADSGIVKQ